MVARGSDAFQVSPELFEAVTAQRARGRKRRSRASGVSSPASVSSSSPIRSSRSRLRASSRENSAWCPSRSERRISTGR